MLYKCEATCQNGKSCSHKARFGKFCGKHVNTTAKTKVNTKAKTDDSNHDSNQDCECPICYDKLSNPLICPNGHKVCQDHYLQYITSTYDTNHVPKGRCFMCRATIPTSSFSKEFIDKLPFIITNAQLKRSATLNPPLPGQPVTIRLEVAMTEMLQFINVIN